MPTIPLTDKRPLKCLFSTQLDYMMLRVFGCLQYPCLRCVEPRSTSCTFLGQNHKHKGYKCLSSNGQLYISRDVIFVEDQFPFDQKPFGKSHTASKPIQIVLLFCHHLKHVSIAPALTKPLKSTQCHLLALSSSTSLNTHMSPIPIVSPTFPSHVSSFHFSTSTSKSSPLTLPSSHLPTDISNVLLLFLLFL